MASLECRGLKTWVTGVTAKQRDRLRQVFPPDRVVRVVQTLGACTYGTPRALTPEELKRGQSARTTLALLSCVGMGLRQFLAAAKVFAMTKPNFGWVGRSPSLQLSKKLFTAVFRHAHRVRYSSPWVRALLFGANVHLDCTWCTRLVGALAKGSTRQMLPWSTRRGSVSATLDAWLVGRGWHRLRPWHWRHANADTELDLRPPARASLTGLRGCSTRCVSGGGLGVLSSGFGLAGMRSGVWVPIGWVAPASLVWLGKAPVCGLLLRERRLRWRWPPFLSGYLAGGSQPSC